MKTDIQVQETASEVLATVTDTKAFQEANNLMFLSHQFGVGRLFAECAAIFNYRICGAYLEQEDKNETNEKFLKSIGMSVRLAQQRLRIAKQMQKHVRINGGSSVGELFYFTREMLEKTFSQYSEKRRNVGITELYQSSKDLLTFTNFLNGIGDTKEPEVVKLLTASTKDRARDESIPAQGNLFSELENRLKKKGYKLRDDGAWFNEETGAVMSRQELGAIIGSEHALHLFSSAKKTLTQLYDAVRAQRNLYAEYTLAYMEVHGDEPDTKRLLLDEQNDLAKLGKDISFFVTTILHED